MSSSDTLRRLADDATALADESSAADAQESELSPNDLAGLLGAVVRLYAGLTDDPYNPELLAKLRVTPTDACTVAAALLRSQSLTPFEFSIWFGGGRVGTS